MSRSKGPKPYKHQSWPKILYHQETGVYKVFKKASQIPDDGMWGPKSTVGQTKEETEAAKQATLDADAEKQRLIDEEAADLEKAQKADDKAAKALFKKLKMTREEAEQMLEEEDEDFDPDADDLTIAMAIKDLLENDSE